jgi:hypothetical protein
MTAKNKTASPNMTWRKAVLGVTTQSMHRGFEKMYIGSDQMVMTLFEIDLTFTE